jgi:hypothetical protein
MSLEGRLRELALPEVLQLLGLSRKTGTLHLQAQVQGRAAFVRITNGAVVDAAQWPVGEGGGEVPAGLASSAAAGYLVEECVLDLLTWRDGDFAFTPEEGKPAPSPVRIGLELMLVESAQRAERWERIADRIASAHVVPAFVDVEPQQLPLLRLVPQEWEILTQVDGSRDLTELSVVLDRELLDVAEMVHGLIGAGLLTLREAENAPRRNPTPPIGAASQSATGESPLPAMSSSLGSTRAASPITESADDDVADDDVGDEDSLFDPAQVGLVSANGMPRFRTTPYGVTAVAASAPSAPTAAVAPAAPETSVERVGTSGLSPTRDATALATHGDMAARRGDLAGALAFWSAALQSEAAHPDADRLREAMALAARLHALLHSAERRS